jgi:hypothetical protein
MIEARISASSESFASRLSRKAAALAEAAVASRRMGSNAPSRWRDARLLWPLFTKD